MTEEVERVGVRLLGSPSKSGSANRRVAEPV
jgi:hypothetical protein